MVITDQEPLVCYKLSNVNRNLRGSSCIHILMRLLYMLRNRDKGSVYILFHVIPSNTFEKDIELQEQYLFICL